MSHNLKYAYVGESNVQYSFDFRHRHEISSGGQTLASGVVVSSGAGVTVGTFVVDGTELTFLLSATVAGEYDLTCTVQLSGGAELVEIGHLIVLDS